MDSEIDSAPDDWDHPRWSEYDRVHGWRNYISDEIEAMWDTFTPIQKRALARQASENASSEHWD